MRRMCCAGAGLIGLALLAAGCPAKDPVVTEAGAIPYCDSRPSEARPQPDASDGAPPKTDAQPAVAWWQCMAWIGKPAHCTAIEVPLDWEHPTTSKKISIRVRKLDAKTSPSRGQLWILQGGPGFGDESIEFLSAAFQEVAPDLDLYFPDHRGTGDSSELRCPELDTVAQTWWVEPPLYGQAVASCYSQLSAQWGADLAFFSAGAAGRDLGEIIARLRKGSDPVFVHGVSYGTRWAHRYLQQFPSQAKGVILDSILTEDDDFYRFEDHVDAAAKLVFDRCTADSFCAGKLGGGDTWAKAKTVLDKVAAGHCPTGKKLTRDDYRHLLAAYTMRGFTNLRELPAIIARLDRCDLVDQRFLISRRTAAEGRDYFFSSGLYHNVVYTELAARPTPAEDVLAAEDAPRLATTKFPLQLRAGAASWTVAERDRFVGAYATTTTPLLMLGGSYDAQTPLAPAQVFATHYTGARQTMVSIPNASHGVFGGATTKTGDCGKTIEGQFLNDPTATIDQSCIKDVTPIDFNPKMVPVAGTTSLFDNGPQCDLVAQTCTAGTSQCTLGQMADDGTRLTICKYSKGTKALDATCAFTSGYSYTYDDCAPGLLCTTAPGTAADTPHCRKGCNVDADCSSVAGTVCQAVTFDVGGRGGVCVPGCTLFGSDCAAGTRCLPEWDPDKTRLSPVCLDLVAAPQPAGGACTAHRDCAVGLYCSSNGTPSVTGTCQTLCDATHSCTTGTCAPLASATSGVGVCQ